MALADIEHVCYTSLNGSLLFGCSLAQPDSGPSCCHPQRFRDGHSRRVQLIRQARVPLPSAPPSPAGRENLPHSCGGDVKESPCSSGKLENAYEVPCGKLRSLRVRHRCASSHGTRMPEKRHFFIAETTEILPRVST